MIPAGQPLFVDETKARGFAFAAATLSPSHLNEARKVLRSARSPGQRSLHFKNESTRRRELILGLIADQGWQAIVIRASCPNMRLARTKCLHAALELACEVSTPSLTVELDTSVEKYDRQDLFEHSRRIGLNEYFRYALLPRHVEPGLWVADAVAWCFARGGQWRKRLEPTLLAIREV